MPATAITNILRDGASCTVEADHTGEKDEYHRHSPAQSRHKASRNTLQFRYVTDSQHTISNQHTFRGQNISFLQQLGKITQDPWVLHAVKGHKLKFTKTPHQTYVPKMHVALEEAALIDLEVQALHKKCHKQSVRANQLSYKSVYNPLVQSGLDSGQS